jgi:hypothetical protein
MEYIRGTTAAAAVGVDTGMGDVVLGGDQKEER